MTLPNSERSDVRDIDYRSVTVKRVGRTTSTTSTGGGASRAHEGESLPVCDGARSQYASLHLPRQVRAESALTRAEGVTPFLLLNAVDERGDAGILVSRSNKVFGASRD